MDKRIFIVIGLLTMSFNSLYQYSWNAFEPLLKTGLNVTLVQVELAFTLFAIFSTVFQGIGGFFADRRGPRIVGIISGILSATGFLGTALIHNLYAFYISWSIGSIGEGILYGISTNLAVKWFIKRRGLSTGIVSLGFGLGASVANIFIYRAVDFESVMLIIGITEVILIPAMMFFVEYPGKNLTGTKASRNLRQKRFWILYLSFITASLPLMVISSSFGYIGKQLPAVEFTILLSVFPLLSGTSRPLLGLVSDYIGRPMMVLIIDVFLILGSLMLIFNVFAAAIVLIGFFGGSMISLYFSLVGDLFGTRFSTSNNGIFYTGKAVSGVIGSSLFAIMFKINHYYSYIFVLLFSILGIIFLYTASHDIIIKNKKS
ncbi:OFA family MFS transporter [Picrophilus oshimae]|uniref:Transport protein n=1 Tax=Picrophilus torridus (strain ATCC 700027 / DSM 9790 / JCM 10055 / NBRC 100828 / KAW 2/3) TaxID=1122961 RepID=Q6KZT7_PICTO|nr:OFA family MFS transporter [Picrophilus oshimae]AAT43765.1 putative transport protein [Picrophilus oshimae DSM 9789]